MVLGAGVGARSDRLGLGDNTGPAFGEVLDGVEGADRLAATSSGLA